MNLLNYPDEQFYLAPSKKSRHTILFAMISLG
jgi:hypothetical protein